MAFLFDRLKVVTEPSGAVGVAALLAGRIDREGQTRRRRRLGRKRRRRPLRRATRPPLGPARARRTPRPRAWTLRPRPCRRRRAAARAPSRSAARRCRRRRRCRPVASRSPRGTPPSAWPRSTMRWIASIGFSSSSIRSPTSGLRTISRTRTRTTSGSCRQRAQQDRRDMTELLARGPAGLLDGVDAFDQDRPVLAEDRLEHFVLRGEVVVEQAVCDAGLLGDVADARRVEALASEDANGGVEDDAPLLLRHVRPLRQSRRRVVVGSTANAKPARRDARRRLDPLPAGRVRDGGAPAAGCPRRPASSSRAATRCARPRRGVVRRPERRQGVGRLRPAGRRAVRACPARAGGRRARVLPARCRGTARRRPRRCGRRPSTARSPASGSTGATSSARATTSTTSAGPGVLADTAPALPPVQIADLAAGALGAVTEILAALLERERTGRGARLVVSMTHGSHRLAAHRLGVSPAAPAHGRASPATGSTRPRTGGGSRSPRSSRSSSRASASCSAGRSWRSGSTTPTRSRSPTELAAASSRRRPLAEWLACSTGEDVCVGPVATLAEAAADLGTAPPGRAAALGEHTAAWRGARRSSRSARSLRASQRPHYKLLLVLRLRLLRAGADARRRSCRAPAGTRPG